MSKPLSRSSTKHYYEITPETLPLSCPLPNNRLWDAHPRVYLPIAKTGHVTCPYCGTEYTLRT
ncbi:uncharacterized protein RVIR1_14790 [Candidatus Rickettsiella viridis]|uniref:Zinc finger CHCC-type domain-containing protein n=1 Tax=Candidatus Rickettsiella viridis TaxID=676208 RepID=A0A2Z5V816_9COXI|nr:zinc-finger domain-containing protein [Candidatus Rickettsiella viridis]BBB15917.1 uncharacterized protein RVIR1_14790 [Candidatus Rickettsiella viridis]